VLGLYPRIKPYAIHRIDVDPPHVLHVEESGDPQGLPVVFVHGGPGAGTHPYHRTFFDPEVYRIILFDQRGCGQSQPHGELKNNTTQALVDDMEKIREFLGVDQWLVFGGSWGATLGLVYAQTHPQRVKALILRGVFLCRDQEIDWFCRGGAAKIYPDYWQKFVEIIPPAEQHDVLAAYYKRLTGENELARMAAAKAWAKWEAKTSTLIPSKTVLDTYSEPHNATSLALIETHYFMNQGTIVQGRYDIVCPMQSAHDLYDAWPSAELDIIPDAGHSATERGITDALIRATIRYGKKFKAGA
jgi:proline iminopeptidase